MIDLLTALALVFVIEGTIYALFPGAIRIALLRLETVPDSALRIGGVLAVAVGVGAVWLIRGMQ